MPKVKLIISDQKALKEACEYYDAVILKEEKIKTTYITDVKVKRTQDLFNIGCLYKEISEQVPAPENENQLTIFPQLNNKTK